MKLKLFTFLFFISAVALAHTVTVEVKTLSENPIPNAHVWINPYAVKTGITDGAGTVNFSNVNGDSNILVVARHSDYGRAEPLYWFVNSDTTFVIRLPERDYLRVATYNIKGYYSWSEEQPAAVAKVFWTVQPDIILGQECRDSDVGYSDFQKKYMPGYTNIVSPKSIYINNGIMSFYPIEETWGYGWSEMTRDLYSATISVRDDLSITFLCAHFKCCEGDYEGNRRNEEAQFTAEHCSNLYAQGEMFLFGGDLNDDQNKTPAPSRVHSILLVSNPAANIVQLNIKDDGGDLNTHDGNIRFDYLYPVNDLADTFVDGRVFRSDTMTNRPAWLDYNETETASDHRLVYADFDIIPEPCPVIIYHLLIVIYYLRKKS